MTPDQEVMLTRRTVAKGAMWSLPVIAAAIAVPGAAASVALDYTLALTSYDVAPAIGTTPLSPNQIFNTVGIIENLGPDTAPNLRAQVTFPSSTVPNEFTVSAGWVITSVTEVNVGGILRWHVALSHAAPLPANQSINFIVTTRTRVAGTFPVGESTYNSVGRVFGADGAIEGELTDSYTVLR